MRPKYAIPVHGEYKHLKAQAKIAQELGISKENIFILHSGDVLELSEDQAQIIGKVPVGDILVDGLGVGDVGDIVLRDRKILSEDGLIIIAASLDTKSNLVAGVEIMSRGFVYVKESEKLMNEVRSIATEAILKNAKRGNNYSAIKSAIKDALGNFIYRKTMRRPMIIPIITEIKG